MQKYTQKELKEFVKLGIAEKLDGTGNEHRHEIEGQNGPLFQIGYAAGVYGCSGALLKASNGKLFAITCRCQAIYIYL